MIFTMEKVCCSYKESGMSNALEFYTEATIKVVCKSSKTNIIDHSVKTKVVTNVKLIPQCNPKLSRCYLSFIGNEIPDKKIDDCDVFSKSSIFHSTRAKLRI